MIIHLMVEKKSGRILALHHMVDAEGRDGPGSTEALMDGLPSGASLDDVYIMSTEVDSMASSREATFDVDLDSRTVTVRKLQGKQVTGREA